MTTINTIEDFVRILDNHPEWVDVIRARLLSRALLDLPEEFARFVAEVRQFVATTNQRLSALESRVGNIESDVGTLKSDVSTLNSRVGNIESDVGTLKSDVSTLNSRVSNIESDVATLNSRVGNIESDVATLKSDVGTLKNQVADVRGRIVYDIARDEAPLLAGEMGYAFSAILSRNDLWQLTKANDVTGISRSDLQSFHRADLVIQATDPDGAPLYIAVEISYTVNGHDTRRAIRNADYLTQLTGLPAVPAIAGVVVDPHLADAVASSEIYWHQIPMGDLRPD